MKEMTPERFADWLHGWVELNEGKMPTPEQWASIVEHLNLVFHKVTSEIGREGKVPVADGVVPDFSKRFDGSVLWPNYHQISISSIKLLDQQAFPPQGLALLC